MWNARFTKSVTVAARCGCRAHGCAGSGPLNERTQDAIVFRSVAHLITRRHLTTADTHNFVDLALNRPIIWACRSSDGDGRVAAGAGHRLSTEHHQDHSRERAGGRAEAPGEVIRAEMSEDDATAPRAED